MRHKFIRTALLVLTAVAAACSDYGSSPSYFPPPPPPPAPPPAPVEALSEGLWTSSGIPSEILRFDPAQLIASGSRVPATRFATSSARLFTLNSLAFDTTGTVWIASQDDSLLLAFAPATANRSGTSVATIVISPKQGSLNAPSGIAFDREHRLWVVNRGNGTIVRFERDQLTSSGAPAPSVVISGAGHPTSIAFDAQGRLWVADIEASTISAYSHGLIETSGVKQPSIVLTSPAISNPGGLAFDAAENLWFTNNGNQTVAAFSLAQRQAGDTIPGIVLKSRNGSLDIPVGLAFDAQGSLWVVGGGGLLTKFNSAQLAASGAPEPSVRLDVRSHTILWSVAFWPKPAGLPLN